MQPVLVTTNCVSHWWCSQERVGTFTQSYVSVCCGVVCVDTITSKAASRLHFVKQLKRSGAGRDDLLSFFRTVIRPVLEYACPVWHPSLTAAQTKSLESLQRRAMRIVSDDDDYTVSLIRDGLDTLETARTTDWALLYAQCAARDVVSSLFATG